MTSERLSSNACGKGKSYKIDLDGFVDEFDGRHDRIKLHSVKDLRIGQIGHGLGPHDFGATRNSFL